MLSAKINILMILILLVSCMYRAPSTKRIGRFKTESDLFLAQFDCKTDVDDILSVAGVATMLADSRLSDVQYHAVAGAYGIQEGLYVPADVLFETAFGSHWSDAHSDPRRALNEVNRLVIQTLKNGGNVWIAEAGQSDFTAALIRIVRNALPEINITPLLHVVQHSDWNERMTTSDDLTYVKQNACYHKIPDGNVIGNGSPGLIIDSEVNLKNYITHPKLLHIWEMALEIANQYNGADGRYNNPSIARGGLDFSDVSETCWIFGFNDLSDTEHFFKAFSL
ncbi:hypothetical protein JW835_05920 [bacterium]|nr:hypothetical protein [bacterium]